MAVAALRPVDPTFESWWVRPGSATVLELRGDDRITVIDPDGGQPAELTVLSPDGRDDPGALGEERLRGARRTVGAEERQRPGVVGAQAARVQRGQEAVVAARA